ncbi:MAG: PKD domain-containing protein [Marinilabiliales bacterium]|nr:PKD domain-containing protein [Marinilabiliales bacterium]
MINIIASPSANFQASSAPCQSDPVQFTDLSVTNGGGMITQWLWNFGDPGSGILNTSTLQNPVHTFSNSGSFSVQLTVTNVNGCTGTITKTISVNPAPLAQFGADAACSGDATQFTDASVANGAGSVIGWLWNFGRSRFRKQ